MIIPWRKVVLLGVSIISILLLTILEENFRSIHSMHFFFQEISILLLLAVGLSFLTLSGSFDLSLGAMFLFSLSLVRLWRKTEWSINSHWPTQLLAGLGIFLIMALIALLLAWLMSIRKNQSLLMNIIFGVLLGGLGLLSIPEFGPWCQPWYCAELVLPSSWLIWPSILFGAVVTAGTIYYFYPDFDWIKPIAATWIMIALGAFVVLEYQGLPIVVLVAVLVLILAELFLNHSLFGLRLRAIGLNEEAARLSGFSIMKTRALAFMGFGACIGLASFFEFEPISREDLSTVFFRQWDVIVILVLGGVFFARDQRPGQLATVALASLLIASLNQWEWLGFSLLQLALMKAGILLFVLLVVPKLAVWIQKNTNLPMRWDPD
ncbi:MAG: ABC transporter permease subunit [Bdellovibrionota bacterium]